MPSCSMAAILLLYFAVIMLFHVFVSYVTIGMPLLGYYAAYSGNSLLTFQESLLVPSSKVKKIQEYFSWYSLLGFLHLYRLG